MLLALPPELLLAIATSLKKTPDILHFGQTCRSIWKVAQEVLWRNNATSYSLCCLFPDDIFDKFSEPSAASPAFDLSTVPSRPITSQEWKPIIHYGGYVRHLSLMDSRAATRAPPEFLHNTQLGRPRYITARSMESLLMILHSSEPGPLLIPNLQSLKIVMDNNGAVSLLPLLLARPLQALDLCLGPLYPCPRDSMVCMLKAIRPGNTLQKMILRMFVEPDDDGLLPLTIDVDDDTVDRTITSLLVQLPNLRFCQIQGMLTRGNYLTALAECPRLETLLIPGLVDLPLPTLNFPDGAFKPLRAFAFETDQQIAERNFFRSISTQSLERLELSLKDRDSLGWFCQVIGDKWRNTLRTLSLSIEGSDEVQALADNAEAVFVDLSPLLHCQQIQIFFLESHQLLPILDRHYEAITRAWPDLREFTVFDAFIADSHPNLASSSTLQHFASNCSKLRYLYISVDFDLVDPVSLQPWTVNGSLAQLDASCSNCSQHDIVAAFLQYTFPSLAAFGTEDTGSTIEGVYGQMAKVEEILQLDDCRGPVGSLFPRLTSSYYMWWQWS